MCVAIRREPEDLSFTINRTDEPRMWSGFEEHSIEDEAAMDSLAAWEGKRLFLWDPGDEPVPIWEHPSLKPDFLPEKRNFIVYLPRRKT